MRVLIIDDDEDVVFSLQTILCAKGVEVVGTGTDGSEAVKLYEELQPDILLMDIQMKPMNGLDAAEQILAKDLEVNAGAGEVNILEFAAEKAEFKCGAGSITATGDAKKKIEADCGVGEINLKIKGKQKDYNYDLDCGIGEIRCGDDSFSGFGREKSIDNGADKKMDIDCGIGSINVAFMEQL